MTKRKVFAAWQFFKQQFCSFTFNRRGAISIKFSNKQQYDTVRKHWSILISSKQQLKKLESKFAPRYFEFLEF